MNLLSSIIKNLIKWKFSNYSIDERCAYIGLGTRRVNRICLLPAIESIENNLIKKIYFPIKKGKTYEAVLGGEKVTILRGGIGSISTRHFIKGLHKGGGDIILRVDVCGSFYGDVGDIIVARDVISEDSFTARKSRLDVIPCDDYLYKITTSVIDEMGIEDRVNTGRLITVDEYWEQKEDEHNRWGESGIGVDMETSTLYHTAIELGMRAISIMCVSDVFLKNRDLIKDPSNFPFNKYKKGIDILMKLTENIIQDL